MQDFPTLAARWAREGIEAPPLLGATETRLGPNVSTLELMTTRGTVVCLRHTPAGSDHDAGAAFAPFFLGGALGGLSGTAGLWNRLATTFGGIRLHYRFPSDLAESLIDVLMVFHHLAATRNLQRVALVGHSFGGGVAVGAGVLLGTDVTAGVVALAGQRSGTELIARLAGVPVFVIHGASDSIIPAASARLVHAEAAEPKRIWYIPGGDHVLAGHVDELEARIGEFIQTLDSGT
jgi:fermentation-respiration switch protein FrsA (DUF1100 family)